MKVLLYDNILARPLLLELAHSILVIGALTFINLISNFIKLVFVRDVNAYVLYGR